MEKYAKLLKGLQMCAGPDCCKDGCPYYGETRGGMTCRARLLNDAAVALADEESRAKTIAYNYRVANERHDRQIHRIHELMERKNGKITELFAEKDKLHEELAKLHSDVDDLEAANNTIRAERDGMRVELAKMAEERTTLLNEIHTMRQGKTDRPSVSSDDLDNLACELQRYRTETGYWHGKAAALEWFIREWFREGGFAP